MAITFRPVPRRGHLQHLLIGFSVALAVVAVSPIVFAIFGGVRTSVAPRSAFATAPAGNYAVAARPDGDSADVIVVSRADAPSSTLEITRVQHLPGYSPSGAVSPDGTRLALVVADGGTPVLPRASLVLVDLTTGAMTRIAGDVQPLQTPLWTPDGGAVVVTRSSAASGQRAPIQFVRIDAAGGEQVLQTVANASWADAVGFDGEGRLVTVVIDGRGSMVQRNGVDVMTISAHITRDWRLSPDGTQLAFIESNTDEGLRYLARSVNLDGGGVAAQQLTADESALGVAWRPGKAAPTYGTEPGKTASAGVQAQALTAAGFDIPLGYSQDGSALAVNHWSGASFAQAGEVSLQLVTDSGRAELPGAARFYGWSAR